MEQRMVRSRGHISCLGTDEWKEIIPMLETHHVFRLWAVGDFRLSARLVRAECPVLSSHAPHGSDLLSRYPSSFDDADGGNDYTADGLFNGAERWMIVVLLPKSKQAAIVSSPFCISALVHGKFAHIRHLNLIDQFIVPFWLLDRTYLPSLIKLTVTATIEDTALLPGILNPRTFRIINHSNVGLLPPSFALSDSVEQLDMIIVAPKIEETFGNSEVHDPFHGALKSTLSKLSSLDSLHTLALCVKRYGSMSIHDAFPEMDYFPVSIKSFTCDQYGGSSPLLKSQLSNLPNQLVKFAVPGQEIRTSFIKHLVHLEEIEARHLRMDCALPHHARTVKARYIDVDRAYVAAAADAATRHDPLCVVKELPRTLTHIPLGNAVWSYVNYDHALMEDAFPLLPPNLDRQSAYSLISLLDRGYWRAVMMAKEDQFPNRAAFAKKYEFHSLLEHPQVFNWTVQLFVEHVLSSSILLPRDMAKLASLQNALAIKFECNGRHVNATVTRSREASYTQSSDPRHPLMPTHIQYLAPFIRSVTLLRLPFDLSSFGNLHSVWISSCHGDSVDDALHATLSSLAVAMRRPNGDNRRLRRLTIRLSLSSPTLSDIASIINTHASLFASCDVFAICWLAPAAHLLPYKKDQLFPGTRFMVKRSIKYDLRRGPVLVPYFGWKEPL